MAREDSSEPQFDRFRFNMRRAVASVSNSKKRYKHTCVGRAGSLAKATEAGALLLLVVLAEASTEAKAGHRDDILGQCAESRGIVVSCVVRLSPQGVATRDAP